MEILSNGIGDRYVSESENDRLYTIGRAYGTGDGSGYGDGTGIGMSRGYGLNYKILKDKNIIEFY